MRGPAKGPDTLARTEPYPLNAGSTIMADRIMWGAISADGTIKAGSGFDCKRLGTGTYIVDWDTPFGSMPAVVVTQNYHAWDDFSYGGGDTRDNAVLLASDANAFKVETGGSDGKKSDRNFAFVAVGPAAG